MITKAAKMRRKRNLEGVNPFLFMSSSAPSVLLSFFETVVIGETG